MQFSIIDKKDDHSICKIIEIDEKEISNKNTISNELNKFFNEIGSKLGRDITSTDNIEDFLPQAVDPTFKFTQVNNNIIMKIVDKLKPKCSAGLDEIPTFLI